MELNQAKQKSLSYLAAIYPGQLALDTNPKKAKRGKEEKKIHNFTCVLAHCLKLKFGNLTSTNIPCKIPLIPLKFASSSCTERILITPGKKNKKNCCVGIPRTPLSLHQLSFSISISGPSPYTQLSKLNPDVKSYYKAAEWIRKKIHPKSYYSEIKH